MNLNGSEHRLSDQIPFFASGYIFSHLSAGNPGILIAVERACRRLAFSHGVSRRLQQGAR